MVLISAWLNTSKDAVTSNQQKGNTFSSRIAKYYADSPKLAGIDKREPLHCKGRWQKINDHVSKFVGSYHAATKERSSGQSEDDVMKMAYQIFANDYKIKFTLEHAWRELRHEQKWCLSYATKGDGSSKRRKFDDQTSSSVPVMGAEEDEA
ncbi:PREDICTED: glutathione S-transferase T3-like [Camelina sativa]|uniref:Glutathione S-transferase T3-like n=1 Tax=Camelina sativa TaxID=90675 RepID=A0ABM0U5N9_CAMSA|nr:PREDICTED: glutathione S-transferase T3-like [Camelina sativa]